MELAKETGHVRQLVAALSAALVVAVLGSCIGWITPTLLTLLAPDSPVPMTYAQASWMIALIEFGNLFTPIPAGYLADLYGRKPLILSTGPIYVVSWVIIYEAHSISALCIARVMQGLALGIVYTLVPMYLGEIPSPKFRGTVTSIFQSELYFGYLIECFVGPMVSYKTLIIVSGLIPVVFMICFVFQPESPYFLVMKKREKEAAKSLMCLGGKKTLEEVSEELSFISKSVTKEMDTQGGWKDLVATPTDRRALLIVNVVGAVKILGGSITIPTYCTQLFSLSGFDLVSPNTLTIITAFISFFTSFFSTALTDVSGRRPLLITSSVGCGISLLMISIFFLMKEVTLVDVQSFSWVCPAALIVYTLFMAFGLDPVSITYRSEMFPANTRAAAASLNTINFTLGSFVSLKFYQLVSDEVGVWAIYMIFSMVCLGGSIWFYVIAIETKGKSLTEVQVEIHNSVQLSRKKFKPEEESVTSHI